MRPGIEIIAPAGFWLITDKYSKNIIAAEIATERRTIASDGAG
jgi:hypothetical protein